MADGYRIITGRILRDVEAVALERVARGEGALLPETALVRYGGEAWPTVPEWLGMVGRARGILRHDETAHYAGSDETRGVAYFVAVPLP